MAEFPQDAILSEEETDDLDTRLAARRVWIIDPIDGTAGFVKKDDDFAVQIGLAEEGRPVLGVVYMPATNSLLSPRKARAHSRAAMKASRSDSTCPTSSDLTSLSLAMSRNHPSARMNRVIEHFQFSNISRRGSVGLKVALIAAQECDIYIHPSPRTKLWDTCGPQIILEEAGGKLTDLFGNEMRYDRRDLQNRDGIVASNGRFSRCGYRASKATACRIWPCTAFFELQSGIILLVEKMDLCYLYTSSVVSDICS